MTSIPERRIALPVAPLLLLLIGTLMLSGCSGLATSTLPSQKLWQSGDQFVAIVPQDTPAAPANDHPANLDRSRLSATLAALRLAEKGEAVAIPLFTEYQLEVLSEQIGSALSRATPSEDVTFAIVGNHVSFLGIAKRPKVTTGRVFVSRGKMNIIFGQAHEEVSDRDDRRLKPFIPGSRTKAPDASFPDISSAAGRAGYSKQAPNWLVLSLLEPAALHVESVQPSAAEPVVRQQQPLPRPVQAGNPEERLRTLNNLREKQLITDEEYRSKRQQILDGI